jgi:hypothetical protein
MVKDEAGLGTQAPGSQVGAVAVAGEDEKVSAVSNGNDFPFEHVLRGYLPGQS